MRTIKKKLAAIRLVLLLVCSSLLLTSCWDLRYLDKLGVVLALGIDVDPSGKHYLQLTAQTVLTQNASSDRHQSGSGPAVTVFTETGDTMFEAIRKMSSKTSRRLFFSHTKMLIISEAMAKKGIYPLLDLIERNPDIRGDISVAVAQGSTAKSMLELTTQQESVPAQQLYQTITVNEEAYGTNYLITVQDIIRLAGMDREQAVTPAIRLIGKSDKKNSADNTTTIPAMVYPSIATSAIFNKGKLAGFLSQKEARGLVWTKNKIVSTVVKQRCPGTTKDFIVEIQQAKSKSKSKLDQDGNPYISITINLIGSIREVMCGKLEVTDDQKLVELGQQTSEIVKEEVEAAIYALQHKFNSDAMGWGKLIYREHPKLWKKIEGDWKKNFKHIKYEVSCHTLIKGAGVRDEAITE